jgi:hypothetical protein
MRFAVLCAALLVPTLAGAQSSIVGAPSLGDSFRQMDRLRLQLERPRTEGLEQTLVLPERPGQNQVAWFNFDWRYADVPSPGGGPGGIRLYFYKTEQASAERALPAIQAAYARLVDEFAYNPTKRIPYILYATQREFQTQNVFAVTESVLGVTSPSDLKMTVPYFGDHQKFVEVSTHELVHQFTIQKLLEAAGAEEIASPIAFLPLWFIEGIAEWYTKGGIDVETDGYLRDLVWNPDPRRGYDILPFPEDRIRGYIPTYKLGQARIEFIADQYGREKIQQFLENAYLLGDAAQGASAGGRNFAGLTRRVLGETLEQVDARWRAWLKRRYYPEYLRAEQDLAQMREVRGFAGEVEDYVVSPDGTLVFYRGIDREKGRARLYLADVRRPRSALEVAVDGVAGTESLHPIEYGVVALSAERIAFSAQDGIGDALYVQRYVHRQREGRPVSLRLGQRKKVELRAPGGGRFVQVADPTFSPDGSQIAFAGLVAGDGQSDVFVVPVGGGTARRVTEDPYVERDLAWGADGIYLASDATDHGRLNLFRLDPATGARTRLTTASATDRNPYPRADGSVLFSSDAAGKQDLYVWKDNTIRRISDFTTSLGSPAPAPKGQGLLASTFHGGHFRVLEVPETAWLDRPAEPVPPAAGEALAIPRVPIPAEAREYESRSPGNWRPEAGFVYGGGGGNSVAGRAAVLFSDMLRDNVLFVDVAVLGSFDYTQALVLYENREARTGWVLGAFHYVQQQVDQLDLGLAYLQRDFGVVGALRYPLDRFRRVELELTLGFVQRYCLTDFTGSTVLACNALLDTVGGDRPYQDRQDWESRNGGVNFQVSPVLRYGHDTIRYDYFTGPLSGKSLLLELGGGFLPEREAVHGFARLDAQRYFQLVGRSNIMFRAAAGGSFSPGGKSASWERTWWLTAADNLRGFYPLDVENLVGRYYYVFNAELQFPLDALVRLLIFDTIEAVAALDFGGIFDRYSTRDLAPRARQEGDVIRFGCEGRTVPGPPLNPGDPNSAPISCRDSGAWDSRTLTGVLGFNVLFGPLLLRVHFGHPIDIGGLETPALRAGDDWVTNITLRYFFF